MQCFQLNPKYLYKIVTEITASSLPRTRTSERVTYAGLVSSELARFL